MGAHNVYRVIEQPSGEVWIRAYPDREQRTHDSTPGQDFDSADLLEQVLPRIGTVVDRSHRHAWRWQVNRVIADPAIPDPSHPRQALVNEVTAATTIAALKAAVLKLL